ncbi:MAG TPA: hypothetical protein VGO62_08140 [Myxococcota bacterium]
MIAPVALLWLASAVDVMAPADCVDAAAVEGALADVGGVDIAESVDVVVSPAPPDHLLLRVELALVRVEPLHRELAIRPLECRDIPALVAALVADQRASMPRPPPALPPPDHEVVPHVPTIFELRDDSGCEDFVCLKPVPAGAATFVSVSAGVGVSTPAEVGPRGTLDFTFGIDTHSAVVVNLAGESFSTSRNAVAAMGVALRELALNDIVELSVRPTVGLGVDDSRFHGISPLGSVSVAGRARVRYIYLELGAGATLSPVSMGLGASVVLGLGL